MRYFAIVKAMAAACLVVLAGPQAAAQDKGSVPLAAYGALPEVEDAAISPDGRNIALLTTVKGHRMLVRLDDNLQIASMMPVGDTKVRDFDWVGNDRLLIVSSQTQDLWGYNVDRAEFWDAQVVPANFDGDITNVFAKNRKLGAAVFGTYEIRQVGGRWQGFFGGIERGQTEQGAYINYNGKYGLFRVDLDTYRTSRLTQPMPNDRTREWAIAADGTLAATFEMDRRDGDWKLIGRDRKTIAQGSESAGWAGLIGLGHDGQTAIYRTTAENGDTQWFEVPLSGGTPRPYLADARVERLYFDRETNYLIGYHDIDRGPVFTDPVRQAAADKIARAFSAYDYRMVDWTPGMGKVLVRTSGNGDSGSWYVVDMADMRAQGFAWERLAIAPERVGPISTETYTARDGLELDGILTLPPGREAKNLPVVMLPHGGPHAHDSEQFDWWAQALASRGYAVFQPNFRGSTNRSDAFTAAGYGEWGRKMQSDISDALAALADRGIVDPERACIAGASYGGYAALAGVTLQQDLYRCAVAVAPVTDLSAIYDEGYSGVFGERTGKTALLRQLGPKDGWNAVSPRRHAARADAPILLIHGRDDTVVPYAHSHAMADALKDAGKPYELIALDGEDHWLSLSQTRQRMLASAVAFIEKHNPAD